MSDNHDDDSAAVATLLVKAGRRPSPPAETRQAVYVSTLVAWQLSLQQRRQQRRWRYALAAGIAAVAAGTLWLSLAVREAPQIVAWGVGDNAPLGAGQTLHVAQSPGRLFVTTTGERLRVAAGSELRFNAAGHLQLLAGRIYVESATAPSAGASVGGLVIDTPMGTTQHIGTRYALELAGQELQVLVREGRVAIATAAGHFDAQGGERLRLDRAGREIQRSAIDTHGADWAWADTLAPALQIDGRVLLDVLQEIAFETGRTLEFADDEVRKDCGLIRLKGPFLDVPATDRLFAVLVTTDLEASENGDQIRIGRRERVLPGPVSD